MAVNKIEINGEVKLDLTQDTVTPATLAKGKTAHDKSGAAIVGTMEASSAKEEQEKTVTVTANGTVEITPDAGKTLSKATAIVNVPTSGGGGPMSQAELYAWIKANGTALVDGATGVAAPEVATAFYVGLKDAYGNVWASAGKRMWGIPVYKTDEGDAGWYWYYYDVDNNEVQFGDGVSLAELAVAAATAWNNVPDDYGATTGLAVTTAVEGYYIFV